jgi:hypothetical protein
MRFRRLRVAVPAALLRRNPPNRGAGRVYHNVLDAFDRARVRISIVEGDSAQTDVWIDGGNSGDVSRNKPVVAICHGAEWLLDPQVREVIPPAYFEAISANTEAAVRSATATIVPSRYTAGARRGLGRREPRGPPWRQPSPVSS